MPVDEELVYRDDKGFAIKQTQDVSDVLASCAAEREQSTKMGAEFKRVARVPVTVITEINEKHGINLMKCNPDQRKKALQIIERDYPYLKTTNSPIYHRT